MSGTDHIEVTGTVVEGVQGSAGKLRLSPARLAPGTRVRLQMSAFDLSQARIVGVEK
jgi:translation initiation factor IF-1